MINKDIFRVLDINLSKLKKLAEWKNFVNLSKSQKIDINIKTIRFLTFI